MNPKEITFTKADLIFVKDRALSHYKAINSDKSLPDGSPLSHADLISLAWIQAVDDLMVRNETGTFIVAKLDDPNSEALEEMYDFEEDKK